MRKLRVGSCSELMRMAIQSGVVRITAHRCVLPGLTCARLHERMAGIRRTP